MEKIISLLSIGILGLVVSQACSLLVLHEQDKQIDSLKKDIWNAVYKATEANASIDVLRDEIANNCNRLSRLEKNIGD